MRGGGGGAHTNRDRLRARAHARPPAGDDRRHRDERARALRRGALRAGHNPAADEDALAGAALISEWLPRVVAAPTIYNARTELLLGASHGWRGARGLDARARARDGAGGRRCLRAAARDAERHRASRRSSGSTRRSSLTRCAASARRSARRMIRPRASRSCRARRPDPPERARRTGARPPAARRLRGRARRQPREPEAGEPGGDRAASSCCVLR